MVKGEQMAVSPQNALLSLFQKRVSLMWSPMSHRRMVFHPFSIFTQFPNIANFSFSFVKLEIELDKVECVSHFHGELRHFIVFLLHFWSMMWRRNGLESGRIGPTEKKAKYMSPHWGPTSIQKFP